MQRKKKSIKLQFLTFYHITKFWPSPNFKELADNKINVVAMMKFVLDWLENIMGKGENAGHQHLLLFPTMFSKAFHNWVVMLGSCCKRLKKF